MRAIWLLAASLAGCAMSDFDYQATVTFPPSAGTVRLNHEPIAPGAVWAASYASFADAVRNPSIVEIAGHAQPIGPDACAAACPRCAFDRADLAFTVDADRVTVTGTCGDGERVVEIR